MGKTKAAFMRNGTDLAAWLMLAIILLLAISGCLPDGPTNAGNGTVDQADPDSIRALLTEAGQFTIRQTTAVPDLSGGRRYTWNMELDPYIPLSLEVELTGGNATIFPGNLNLTDLRIRVGAEHALQDTGTDPGSHEPVPGPTLPGRDENLPESPEVKLGH